MHPYDPRLNRFELLLSSLIRIFTQIFNNIFSRILENQSSWSEAYYFGQAIKIAFYIKGTDLIARNKSVTNIFNIKHVKKEVCWKIKLKF